MAIVVDDYNPDWSEWYEEAKIEIAAALGELLVHIEHIGSTAVPGLAAKPIVDVMPGVRDRSDLDRCIEPMQQLGYVYVQRWETELPERRFFRKRQPLSQHDYNVHLYRVGDDSWVRHLLFRDYLRSHADVAQEYARLKRELAPQFADVNDYAGAKTEFIRAIEARALAERR